MTTGLDQDAEEYLLRHIGFGAADLVQQAATGPLDIALRIWHVPSTAYSYHGSLLAAASVAEVATSETTRLEPMDLNSQSQQFRKNTTVVIVAELAAILPYGEANWADDDPADKIEVAIDDLPDAPADGRE